MIYQPPRQHRNVELSNSKYLWMKMLKRDQSKDFQQADGEQEIVTHVIWRMRKTTTMLGNKLVDRRTAPKAPQMYQKYSLLNNITMWTLSSTIFWKSTRVL